MGIFERNQDHAKERVKKLRTLVMLFCPNLYHLFGNVLVCTRGETIWINAVLRIAFECIAIYCHIAIFDWILVKRHFIWEYGFWQ